MMESGEASVHDAASTPKQTWNKINYSTVYRVVYTVHMYSRANILFQQMLLQQI